MMSEAGPRILLVVGNLARRSRTRLVVLRLGDLLREQGGRTDLFDCATEEMPLFDVERSYSRPAYASHRERVSGADVLVLGTPDYHGCMSSALKNFLDHFWKEFAGKLFVSVVGSHERGLTVQDQIRTVARQSYAWCLPYGVSFHEKEDFESEEVPGASLESRLRMMAADTVRYGGLLSRQRREDLGSTGEGFMARYRR